MEENSFLNTVEDLNHGSGLLRNNKPLLDMDDFETLEASSALVSEMNAENVGRDLLDDFTGVSQSGLVSTARPLSTSNEDIVKDDRSSSPNAAVNLSEFENLDKTSLIDTDTRADDPFRDPAQDLVQRSEGDRLLIDEEAHSKRGDEDDEFLISSSTRSGGDSPFSFHKVLESETSGLLPKGKDPKIGTKTTVESDNYEFEKTAYETAAQPAEVKQREVAMEAETVGKINKNCESECPLSPGAWFHPDKLHPTVAEYVYWRDPKKSGIVFGSLLVLLLSLKYFSFISVVAYITLALLTVTSSYRIFKNVAQAIQKSNEGHPFKEFLEMDITLSQEKVGETVEVLINHVNCVTALLRSLVLVEDLFDTFKFGVLAWCLTYVGAWFNGLTLVILVLVSAFTLPKVYETNKAQIDMYADLVRTKSKEVIEMVNAKMPMGKKKKDQ